MPLKQDELNRQLSRAEKALADWSGILKERGVSDDQRHRDPVWRSLNAQRRQLSRKMKTSAEIIALNQELIKRKSEKSQVVTAPEKTKPKSKKKKDASKKSEKKDPKKKKETKSKKSGTKKKTPAKKKAKKK